MRHYQTIQGWFNCPDLYSQMVERAKDGYRFVEIGCWKGQSAAYMAEEIKNSGKAIEFFCVDTWMGTQTEDGHQRDPAVVSGSLYETFIGNLKPFENLYKPLRMPSVEAAKTFEDNSLDFIYIDAGHEYEDVKADIEVWLPKLKKGGVIAGDDFNGRGVSRAVNEQFHDVKSPNRFTWVVYR